MHSIVNIQLEKESRMNILELVVQFPARGVTQVLLCLFLVCCGCDTFYKVSVYIQYQVSIYALSLCRGHSWRVRLAKQETLTPPGHLVSPLVCRGPWIFCVVFYCWYHSDSASVLLYFTFRSRSKDISLGRHALASKPRLTPWLG